MATWETRPGCDLRICPKRGIVAVAVHRVRAIELSMIEGVERLKTEFQ